MQKPQLVKGQFGESISAQARDITVDKNGQAQIVITGKGFDEPEVAEVNGAAFANGAKDLVRRCQPGTTVTIGEIKVTEPGGGTRKLDQNITFILQ